MRGLTRIMKLTRRASPPIKLLQDSLKEGICMVTFFALILNGVARDVMKDS